MRRVAREAVEDAAADGCDFLEIRFGPSTHARPGFSIADVIAAACEGLDEGRRATGLPVGLVVCLLRHLDDETNLAVARAAAAAAGKGVVGLDVAGDELLLPVARPVSRAVRDRRGGRARADGPRRRGGPGVPPPSRRSTTLGVTRIGHGSHIADDPAALAWAARRGDRDRGLPDVERPDRRGALDPRASAPRVPRRRLPGRPRRRQPDQHRLPDLGRGGAPRRARAG